MEKLKKSWGLASAQLESIITSLSPKTVQTILLVIVIGIAIFRLATISVPSLEWTSWKEIDYLAISKNFWQHGFNILKPCCQKFLEIARYGTASGSVYICVAVSTFRIQCINSQGNHIVFITFDDRIRV